MQVKHSPNFYSEGSGAFEDFIVKKWHDQSGALGKRIWQHSLEWMAD